MDSLCIAPESPNHSYLTTCSIESRGIVCFDQRWSIMVFHDHGWVNQFRFSDNVLQKKFKRQRTRWWAQNQVGRLSLARHLEWLLVLKARFCLYYCIGFEMDWSNAMRGGETVWRRCIHLCMYSCKASPLHWGRCHQSQCLPKDLRKTNLGVGTAQQESIIVLLILVPSLGWYGWFHGAGAKSTSNNNILILHKGKCSEFPGIAGGLSSWTCLLPRSNIPWHTGYPIERRVVVKGRRHDTA